MANGEFLEVLSPNALKDLQALNAELVKTTANMKAANENMIGIKTPSGSDSAIKELNAKLLKQEELFAKVQIKLEQYAQAQNRTKISSNQLEKSTISLEQAIERKNKALEREQARLNASQTLYGKLGQKLASLRAEYSELATKQQLRGRLSDEEAKRLDFLTQKTQKYVMAQDAVNTTMGKYQQRVGAYGGQFNSLGNSINQLTREMPAFTYSVQTGFMALSNNIPIFSDAIGNAIKQNKLLQAEGKPTTSVLSQVAGAFLSWQTLMGVGITLLTVYGKEIGDWISSMSKASKVIDVQKESQKALNEASTLGAKNAVEETLKVRSLLEIAKDMTLTYQQRMIAVKELQDTYPAYFGNLTKEKILAGETAIAEKELTDAILSRAKANAAIGKITENQAKIIDFEIERLNLRKEADVLNQKILSTEKALQNSDNVTSSQGIALSQMYDKRASLISKINKLSGEKYGIEQLNNTLTDFAIEKQKEAILLDYKKEKADNAANQRLRNNYAEAESLFNLRIARLEELRLLQKEIQDNESATDYGRLEARKEYSRLSLEILEEQFAKENALADLKFKEDLEKANEVYLKNKKNGFDDVQNANEYKKAIADITARYNNEKELSDINYSKKFKENAYSDAEFNEKVLKATFDKEEKYRKKTIEETDKLNEQINKSNQKKYQKIANDESKTLKARQLAFDEYKNLALLEIQIEQQKALAKADPTEYDTIIQKYKDLKEGVESLETPLDIANKKTQEFLRSFQTDFINKGLEQLGLNSLKIFLDIDANGQSTFDKLIESAKLMKEEWKVALQASADIFQDIYGKINEKRLADIESEKNALETKRKIAIAFANGDENAIAEIERQAEERRKALARREFQAKKEQALFNIAIDTAQAIMATLGKTGFFGIPLTFIVGAIGAAQAITVASQKMPEFYKGTDNAPDGLAWTQERGAEVITDKKGRVKTLGSNKGAMLTKLDAGDKVYTAEKSKQLMFNSDFSEVLFNSSLSNMMQSAGIGMSDSKPQIDIRQDLHQLGKDVVSAINNKTEYHQTFDNNGINNYISNGHTRKQIKNNHVTFTKQSF